MIKNHNGMLAERMTMGCIGRRWKEMVNRLVDGNAEKKDGMEMGRGENGSRQDDRMSREWWKSTWFREDFKGRIGL